MSITLSQLIDQVREELLAPRDAKTSESMYPFLFVEEIELEIGVTVSCTVEGGGKVNVQVIEVGSRIDRGNEQIHCVKVKMTPLFTKDEVREQLKQNERTWNKARQTGMQGTAKNLFLTEDNDR